MSEQAKMSVRSFLDVYSTYIESRRELLRRLGLERGPMPILHNGLGESWAVVPQGNKTHLLHSRDIRSVMAAVASMRKGDRIPANPNRVLEAEVDTSPRRVELDGFVILLTENDEAAFLFDAALEIR